MPEGHFATDAKVAVTLYYFPAAEVEGDVDNIVKYILDAMKGCIYIDDDQVQRVVVQKFEPGSVFQFRAPSEVLANAIDGGKPLLYIRISDDPFEDLQ